MKLHIRLVRANGRAYRLITLRPHTKVAYSTNYFHQTWHIISDPHGAQLLARLMWGLSYQRAPQTVVLLHGEHIKPTPFGAERSDPILLTLGQSGMDQQSLGKLRGTLKRLGKSQGTVRWHTFGLDAALRTDSEAVARDRTREDHDSAWLWYRDSKRLWKAEHVSRLGGFVCYCAPPRIMRQQALTIAGLKTCKYDMDYHYLDCDGRWPAGEVQIFRDYHQRRSAAAEARRTVLALGREFSDEQGRYQAIAVRRDTLLRNRRRSRRQGRRRVPTGSYEGRNDRAR